MMDYESKEKELKIEYEKLLNTRNVVSTRLIEISGVLKFIEELKKEEGTEITKKE